MSHHHNILDRSHDPLAGTPDRAAFFRTLAAHMTELADEFASDPERVPTARDSLQLAAFAEALIKSRQRRSHWIASSLLGEPAWDLLLQLYANAVLDRRQTAKDLAAALNVEMPTVLRWSQALIERGLVSCNIYENRTTCIELVAASRSAMGDMLNEWRHLGQLFGRGN